jgi:hypothetical protein
MQLIPYHGDLKQLEQVQVVILDGDHVSPEALQSDQLVHTALRSGIWVLALDVTEDHKRLGLADTLSVATDGANLAYLVHMGRDENNRPQVDVVEVPIPENLERGAAAASTIVGALLERSMRSSPAMVPGVTGSEIPPGLLYVTYVFSQLYYPGILSPYIYHDPTGNQPLNPDLPQSPSLQVNETVTVFLNNQNNPQGDFQFVVAEVDVTAAPKLPGESFATFQPGPLVLPVPSGDYAELGWFQTKAFTTQIAPPEWTTVATSPETVNGQDSVTSGVSFQVGFDQTQGGNANFGYSSSTTHSIRDWKVTNDSAVTKASWHYRTDYPVDADQPDYYCREQTDLYSQYSCFPETLPNDLSINTLQLHTSAAWRTPSVVDGPVTITVQSVHELVLLWCPEEELDFIFFRCYSPAQLVDTFNYGPKQLSINLGAVVPVPIQSVTFDHNPATAGTTVIGTVTLKSPALLDTEILLSSNSENATVLPAVTVKQGQTSATFQVLTNANGLVGQNCSTTATIDAFYAQDFQVQLTVSACP